MSVLSIHELSKEDQAKLCDEAKAKLRAAGVTPVTERGRVMLHVEWGVALHPLLEHILAGGYRITRDVHDPWKVVIGERDRD